MSRLVPANLLVSFASGVLTVVVGIAHVAEVTDATFDCEPKKEAVCVGPFLWRNVTGNFTLDQNQEWRSLFTLDPDTFTALWAPLFGGLITVLMHLSEDLRLQIISASWARVSLWLTFQALFLNFPYAGQLGIAVGFVSLTAAILGIFIDLRYSDAPTSLGGSPNPKCLSCEGGREKGFGILLMALSIGAGLLVVAVGFDVILERVPKPCSTEYVKQAAEQGAIVECVGPSLFWSFTFENKADFNSEPTDPINTQGVDWIIPKSLSRKGSGGGGGGGSGSSSSSVPPNLPQSDPLWSSVFILAPGAFLSTFTPLILGSIAIAAQMSSTSIAWMQSSSTVALFYFITAFLVGGFSGNLGVLAFFSCLLVAILAGLQVLLANAAPITRLGLLDKLDYDGSVRGFRMAYPGSATPGASGGGGGGASILPFRR